MATIVKTLVTKWAYKVDVSELKKARTQLKAIKGEMTQVRKTSVAFGKGELNRIRRVRNAWGSLNKKVKEYGNESVRSGRKAKAAQSGGALIGGFKGFAAARGLGLGAGAAAGLAAGPGIAAITGIAASLKAFATRELAEINIGRLLGEGADAAKFTDQLGKFATETSFSVKQVRELAQNLLASDFAANQVIPTLSQLGDVSGGSADKMNRLLINFVQIRDNGVAMTRDIRQFTTAGVPLLGTLAKQLGKTKGEIMDMASKSQISAAMVQKALDSLTGKGGKFYKAQDTALRTSIGRFNELAETIQLVAEKIGMAIDNNGLIQKFLESLTLDIQYLTKAMKDSLPAIKLMAAGGALLFAAFFPVLGLFTTILLFLDDLIAYNSGRNSLIGHALGENAYQKGGPSVTERLWEGTKTGLGGIVDAAKEVGGTGLDALGMMGDLFMSGITRTGLPTPPPTSSGDTADPKVVVNQNNHNTFTSEQGPEAANAMNKQHSQNLGKEVGRRTKTAVQK